MTAAVTTDEIYDRYLKKAITIRACLLTPGPRYVLLGSAERGGIGGPANGTCGRLRLGPFRIDTMHMLTGLTGGKLYYNRNGIEDSIEKAIEDSELVYRLGFYASEDTLDGKFHKLSVGWIELSVDVRFRRGYFGSKIPRGSPQGETALNHLLRDTLDATAVGLTVQASPEPAEPSTFHVGHGSISTTSIWNIRMIDG